MLKGWVDNGDYMGPCRRTGKAGRRFFERRQEANGAEPPALATLLRQLRMTDLAFAPVAEQQRYRLLLRAAAEVAAELGNTACHQELAHLVQLIEGADNLKRHAGAAHESLARAAARLL